MEPVQIVRVIGVRGRERQSPVPMFVDDPVGAGGRFGQCEGVVLDYGCGTDGEEGFELGGRKEGAALVGF